MDHEIEYTEMVFNKEEALDRVDGDFELFVDIISIFVQDTPEKMAQIEKELQQQDAESLKRTAHSLKGSIGVFCADSAYSAALKLESDAREGDWEKISTSYKQLDAEVKKLSDKLVEFAEG